MHRRFGTSRMNTPLHVLLYNMNSFNLVFLLGWLMIFLKAVLQRTADTWNGQSVHWITHTHGFLGYKILLDLNENKFSSAFYSY